MQTSQDITSTIGQKGHQLLLFTLVLLILASPFVSQVQALYWFSAGYLVIILLAAARTVTKFGKGFLTALLLGVPALLSQIAVLVSDYAWLETIRYIFTSLFFFWVCFLLLKDIALRSHTVTLELIVGAVNVYLMLGVAFSLVYALIEHLQPGSFSGLESFAANTDQVMNFLYFSFITISTLGYGDISPLTPHGMTTAYVQAIFGQLYLAILVARLVSLYIGLKR